MRDGAGNPVKRMGVSRGHLAPPFEASERESRN